MSGGPGSPRGGRQRTEQPRPGVTERPAHRRLPAEPRTRPYALLVPLVAQPFPGRRLALLVRGVVVGGAEQRQAHRRPHPGRGALEHRGLGGVALRRRDQREQLHREDRAEQVVEDVVDVQALDQQPPGPGRSPSVQAAYARTYSAYARVQRSPCSRQTRRTSSHSRTAPGRSPWKASVIASSTWPIRTIAVELADLLIAVERRTQQCLRTGHVVGDQGQTAGAVLGVGQREGVSAVLRLLPALGERGERGHRVALEDRHIAEHPQRLQPRPLVLGVEENGPLQPVPPLRQPAAADPVEPERAREVLAEMAAARLGQTLLHGTAQIRQLRLHTRGHLALPGREPVQLAPGGEPHVPVAVAPPQPGRVARRRQPVGAVRPDRVQHAVAHTRLGLLAGDHRLREQLAQHVQDVVGVQAVARAHVLGRPPGRTARRTPRAATTATAPPACTAHGSSRSPSAASDGGGARRARRPSAAGNGRRAASAAARGRGSAAVPPPARPRAGCRPAAGTVRARPHGCRHGG